MKRKWRYEDIDIWTNKESKKESPKKEIIMLNYKNITMLDSKKEN